MGAIATALAVLVVLLILLAYHARSRRMPPRCGACPPGTGEPGSGAVCYWKKGAPAAGCVECVGPGDCPPGGAAACINNACVCRDGGDCPAGASCCGGACRECCDSTQCRAEEVCTGGRCEPALRCNTNRDCGPYGLCGSGGTCLEASPRTCNDGDWECGPRSYCDNGRCYVPMGPLAARPPPDPGTSTDFETLACMVRG